MHIVLFLQAVDLGKKLPFRHTCCQSMSKDSG